jgi:palmitoyltransferase ZDHHC4
MVSVHHHWISFIVASACFYSYYLACKVKPGIIDKKNYKEYVAKYKEYYDGITFEKDKECSTCKIIK